MILFLNKHNLNDLRTQTYTDLLAALIWNIINVHAIKVCSVVIKTCVLFFHYHHVGV